MSRSHPVLVGLLTAGILALPLLSTAVAAPAKKAAVKKTAKKPAGKKPAAKSDKADAANGKTLFGKEGCTGCHKTTDFATGGDMGPDLSKIGGEKKPLDLVKAISHPKSGSIMPPMKDVKKAADLAAYLMTQK
jgi:cytochrome c551/c552